MYIIHREKTLERIKMHAERDGKQVVVFVMAYWLLMALMYIHWLLD